MIYFILILIINCLIGCVCVYVRFKEITLSTLICSLFCGWVFPMIFIFEPLFNILDKLDDIKIIKK